MYINNKKRKLDAFDLDVLQNADYFTCVYYKPRDKSLRIEYGTYKEAYFHALDMLKRYTTENYDKRKFMFYAVKGTSQTFIGGLK
jgi:hypothetical protein